MACSFVVFRVDSSAQIGSGHLIRCLTLAEGIRSSGGKCTFICREFPGNMIDEIVRRGFLVHRLPYESSLIDSKYNYSYESWLGVDWNQDAIETITCLRGDVPDWLVIDHYGIDRKWETVIRTLCRRIMVIDDIANRRHSADILLDQNYEDYGRYKSLINKESQLLLGPRYALLRPEYKKCRDLKIKKNKSVKRVLIYFGLSDSFNLTIKSLRALCDSGLDSLDVDIIISHSYNNLDLLRKISCVRGRVTIHSFMPHLADLMLSSDLAIGAGGVTSWERICLSLPSLVVTTAENQVPISNILHSKGLINLLGRSEIVDEKIITQAIIQEIHSRMIANKFDVINNLCDGEGVDRVIQSMSLI